MIILNEPIKFEWDKGNSGKNWIGHKVTDQECEEAFFDSGKKMLKDARHSGNEERYILLGITKQQRLLFLIFTTRNKKVRVISARNVNKRENKLYHE